MVLAANDRGRAAVERGVTALLEWAASLRFDDIPLAARRRMALAIGDDAAAMLSAQDEPQVRAVHEQLQAESRSGEATLLRRGGPRLDRHAAALGNGLAATWNELDEGFRKAPCHAGACSLPALFAVAEAEGLSAREVIRAGVGAYEIAGRFAIAWRSIIPPVHPHALFATVGSAAAVGIARGLDARTLTLAVTGAVTLSAPGPYDHAIRGALARNAWTAAGAEVGMRCVDWARAGIGGLPSSPYDVYTGCFGGNADAGALDHALGGEWAVCDGYHKLYACCQYAHSALEALAELLSRRPELHGGEAIESIRVETHRLGLTLDNYQPHTTLAAKFSMPHALAAALVYGGAGVESFASGTLVDPRVARLRSAVAMSLHPGVQPWPLDRPARVTLSLAGGETLVAQCASARGGPDQPFAETEIRDKIRALGLPSAPGIDAAVERLLRGVERGDDPELDRPWASWMASLFEREPA